LNHQTKGALLVMSAGLLWGTLGIFSKLTYAETSVGPISLAWFRLVFAIPILAVFTLFKKYEVSLTRREVLLFIAFGFCSLTVFEALYFTTIAYTNVQHAVALLYTGPGFVAILSRAILKERMSRAKVTAVILSMLGAFLILGLARGEPLFTSKNQLGDWLAIGSGMAYSTWYIFGKVLGTNREPAVTSLVALSFGAVPLFAVMFAMEGFHLPEDTLAWSLVAGVGFLPTALAYLLYLGGLKLIEATKASVFAIMEPVSAATFAFLLFHETFTPDALLGFVMIIASILLMSKTNA